VVLLILTALANIGGAKKRKFDCIRASRYLHKCRRRGYEIGNCVVGKARMNKLQKKKCPKVEKRFKANWADCHEYLCEQKGSDPSKRQKLVDEITPISGQLSAIYSYSPDEVAEHAFDRDWDTEYTAGKNENGEVWIEFKFDEVYCIKEVIGYSGKNKPGLVSKCSGDSSVCACEEPLFSTSVSFSEANDKEYPTASDCRYGDTVHVEYLGTHGSLRGSEIAVTGKRASD